MLRSWAKSAPQVYVVPSGKYPTWAGYGVNARSKLHMRLESGKNLKPFRDTPDFSRMLLPTSERQRHSSP
eukprot:1423485-Amphidinium_carterae.1